MESKRKWDKPDLKSFEISKLTLASQASGDPDGGRGNNS